MPREQLYERINRRVDEMIQGLVDEVKKLWEQGYGLHLTSMQAIGYKEIVSYLKNKSLWMKRFISSSADRENTRNDSSPGFGV